MNLRTFATTVGSLVMLGASAAAGLTCWVLLTAPTTVAGMLGGPDPRPLTVVAWAIHEALSRLVRYL